MATIISKRQTAKSEMNATRMLLGCGVAAGALFIGLNFIQAFTRPGFDRARNAISYLLLGDLGWIQLINFVGTGVLAIAFAFGMRRWLHPGKAGTFGPLLIGMYGVGLIIAGFFAPDPSFGFPPGAPEGIPPVMSGHATLHAIGFFTSMPSLVAACFVFARRFAAIQNRGWATYCMATGIAAPALVILSMVLTASGKSGLPLLGVLALTSGWLVMIAMRLLRE